MIIANELKSVEKTEYGYMLETNGPRVMLVFMTDDILRVRALYDFSGSSGKCGCTILNQVAGSQ